jgi:hypothetical protein
LQKIYIVIIVIAFIVGFFIAGYHGRNESRDLRIRLDEANRDLQSTRTAQQEAVKRVDELQVKLDSAAKRVNELQATIDGLIQSAADVAIGIGNAEGTARECAKLIGENGSILQRIRAGGQSND